MRALIVVDLNDSITEAGDVAEAIEARLDEFYPDSAGGFSQPKRVTIAVGSDDAIAHILNAADVALDTDTVTADVQDEAASALAVLWGPVVGAETQARLNG